MEFVLILTENIYHSSTNTADCFCSRFFLIKYYKFNFLEIDSVFSFI